MSFISSGLLMQPPVLVAISILRPMREPGSAAELQAAFQVWDLYTTSEDPATRGERLLQKGRALLEEGRPFRTIAATSFRAAQVSFEKTMARELRRANKEASVGAARNYLDAARGESEALKRTKHLADTYAAYLHNELLLVRTEELVKEKIGRIPLCQKLQRHAAALGRRAEAMRSRVLEWADDTIIRLTAQARLDHSGELLLKAETAYQGAYELAILSARLAFDESARRSWVDAAAQYRERVSSLRRDIAAVEKDSTQARPLYLSRVRLDEVTNLLLDRRAHLSHLSFAHLDIPIDAFRSARSDPRDENSLEFLKTRGAEVGYDDQGGALTLSQGAEASEIEYTVEAEWLTLFVFESIYVEVMRIIDMHGAKSHPLVRVLAHPEQLAKLFDETVHEPTTDGRAFVSGLVRQINHVMAPGQEIKIRFYSRLQDETDKPWGGIHIEKPEEPGLVRYSYEFTNEQGPVGQRYELS